MGADIAELILKGAGGLAVGVLTLYIRYRFTEASKDKEHARALADATEEDRHQARLELDRALEVLFALKPDHRYGESAGQEVREEQVTQSRELQQKLKDHRRLTKKEQDALEAVSLTLGFVTGTWTYLREIDYPTIREEFKEEFRDCHDALIKAQTLLRRQQQGSAVPAQPR